MNEKELKQRTKEFALRIIQLVESLSKSTNSYIIGKQLLRAGTSVGANYRAACRSRSKADFISKVGVVEEEADESGYWLEIIIESGLLKTEQVQNLLMEANELTAIFSASRKTAKL
jgi:four helix bundle protein